MFEQPLNPPQCERVRASEVARELFVRVERWLIDGAGDSVKDLSHSFRVLCSGCVLRVVSAALFGLEHPASPGAEPGPCATPGPLGRLQASIWHGTGDAASKDGFDIVKINVGILVFHGRV
jgi:hypothetical protein